MADNKVQYPTVVAIKLYNDLTYDEFAIDFGKNSNIEKYADAFTNIIIYAKNKDRLKLVFDEETS